MSDPLPYKSTGCIGNAVVSRAALRTRPSPGEMQAKARFSYNFRAK